MQKFKRNCLLLIIPFMSAACSKNKIKENGMETQNQPANSPLPHAEQFTKSSLRNRISIELNADTSVVWNLIGDPGRMPEYSSGLLRVDTEKDSLGRCKAYVCYFKPMAEGTGAVKHRSEVVWQEKNRGWASIDEEPNAFGLQESLSMLILEAKQGKCELTWEMYFNCSSEEAVQMNRSALTFALDDIAKNLISKFGGKVLERVPASEK